MPDNENKKKNKEKFNIYIYEDWCKCCYICEEFCPTNVLGHDDAGKIIIIDLDLCIGCGQCEIRCPDFAIEIKVRE